MTIWGQQNKWKMCFVKNDQKVIRLVAQWITGLPTAKEHWGSIPDKLTVKF